MLKLFEKYKKHCEAAYWIIGGILSSVINGLSVYDDIQRQQLNFEYWEPFVWESSSQLSMLILIPFLLILDRKFPLDLNQLKRCFIVHWLFSIVFSVLHVGLMVVIRKLSYFWVELNYEFGDWWQELIYEYRKDLMTYISIIATFYVYRFILSRLLSEAKEINVGENAQQSVFVERLIVKKIGKEFILKVSDIDWVEAAGNYMNLHIGERCYPLRSTMADIERRFDPKVFARIHRSSMVNLNAIMEIIPLESGDFDLNLKSGQQLKLSRRYREKIKQLIEGQ